MYPSQNFAISHREPAQFIPSGTHIWRGLSLRQWNGHCKPYRRVSEKRHADLSERQAMDEVVRKLWRQWGEFHGLPLSVCTVACLFGDSELEAV